MKTSGKKKKIFFCPFFIVLFFTEPEKEVNTAFKRRKVTTAFYLPEN